VRVEPRVHQLRLRGRLRTVEAADVLGDGPGIDELDPRRDQAHLDQVVEELLEALVRELVVLGRLTVVDEEHAEGGRRCAHRARSWGGGRGGRDRRGQNEDRETELALDSHGSPPHV
jgi:hypothetical protein